jgi:hypothetical protein
MEHRSGSAAVPAGGGPRQQLTVGWIRARAADPRLRRALQSRRLVAPLDLAVAGRPLPYGARVGICGANNGSRGRAGTRSRKDYLAAPVAKSLADRAFERYGHELPTFAQVWRLNPALLFTEPAVN